jgi:hypothetical protein
MSVAEPVRVVAEDAPQDEEHDGPACTSNHEKEYLAVGFVAMAIFLPDVVISAVLLIRSNGNIDEGAAKMSSSFTSPSLAPSVCRPPNGRLHGRHCVRQKTRLAAIGCNTVGSILTQGCIQQIISYNRGVSTYQKSIWCRRCDCG